MKDKWKQSKYCIRPHPVPDTPAHKPCLHCGPPLFVCLLKACKTPGGYTFRGILEICTKWCIRRWPWSMFVAIAHQLYLTYRSKTKRHILNGRVVIWHLERLHIPCTFRAMCERKKEQNGNFYTWFSHPCERLAQLGHIFHKSIVNTFCMQAFYITLLWVLWNCSYTLCTAGHFEHDPSLLKTYYSTSRWGWN